MTILPLKIGTMRSEEEKQAVGAQLEQILEHPAFRNSLRSARFLRYVVEYWLEDDHHGEPLKERALGAALFGLDPAYDTNQNTVVRNAAVDVRKRLVQYYHEPGHEDEIQITMPAGAYMPHIIFPTTQEATSQTEESLIFTREAGRVLIENLSALPLKQARPFWRHNWFFLLSFIILVLAANATYYFVWQRQSYPANGLASMDELNQFWHPVLDTSAPEPIITICVEQLPSRADLGQDVMPVGDAIATSDFVRLLDHKKKMFRIAVANTVAAQDVQSATVLMVGGVDNFWTSYVTEGLRFHFSSQTAADSRRTVWIEDRKNPMRRDWSLSAPSPSPGVVLDFALIARVMDTKSGLWRVVAAGLDGTGTSIAARSIVDPNYLKELTKQLPKGWISKNIEMVIMVKVVEGKVGFPLMVAYEVW